ncbi:MAG: hypothetical protein JSV86_21665 [Gemmatimonadota bacterium]|nr:MAG: hypothetical protein JSV86_21665 [Gemmatimonadota bacterium]
MDNDVAARPSTTQTGRVSVARRLVAVSAVIGLLFCQACTTVIMPPVVPDEPRTVFLLDHGRHASLALPGRDGGVVRYSYGDWRYYAQVNTGLSEASAAVLWPSRAGLGRRELSGPPTAAAVRRQLLVWVEGIYELVVDSQEIEALRARLDSIYEANLETRIYNAAYDLEFVHHPSAYWVFHNSNQVIARWLKELDCRVGGPVLLSNWKVDLPPDGSDSLFDIIIVISKKTETPR